MVRNLMMPAWVDVPMNGGLNGKGGRVPDWYSSYDRRGEAEGRELRAWIWLSEREEAEEEAR